jgi:hypothetical protein
MGGRPRGRPRGDRPRQPARPKPAGRGRRAARALNPRKTPTNSRIRIAALAFGALAVVLGMLGLTVNRAYLQPAVLTLLLAVLWGVRAITMR